MSKLVDVFEEIERKLARDKGPFTLFALFERQDFPNRWDLAPLGLKVITSER